MFYFIETIDFGWSFLFHIHHSHARSAKEEKRKERITTRDKKHKIHCLHQTEIMDTKKRKKYYCFFFLSLIENVFMTQFKSRNIIAFYFLFIYIIILL